MTWRRRPQSGRWLQSQRQYLGTKKLQYGHVELVIVTSENLTESAETIDRRKSHLGSSLRMRDISTDQEDRSLKDIYVRNLDQVVNPAKLGVELPDDIFNHRRATFFHVAGLDTLSQKSFPALSLLVLPLVMKITKMWIAVLTYVAFYVKVKLTPK